MFKLLRKFMADLFLSPEDADKYIVAAQELDVQEYIERRSSDPAPRNAYEIQYRCELINETITDEVFLDLLRVEIQRRFTAEEIRSSYGLKTVTDRNYACPAILVGVIYLVDSRIGEKDDD